MIETIPLKPFDNLISYLMRRHRMFGIETLKELSVFLNGYGISISINDCKDDQQWDFFKKEFDWFVQDFFNEKTTRGWVYLIHKRCENKEDEFKKFEEIFNKFISQ